MTAKAAGRRVKPKTAVDASRQVAYDALRLVDTEDAYLNLALPRLLHEREISGRDAGFATELAHGTARMQGSYDAIIGSLVKGGEAALQAEVRTGLRLGAHQLLSMRVPAYAAVGTSVELVRAAAGERPVRLVNAVLRKLDARPLSEWLEDLAPSRAVDLVGYLAVVHSHPRWVVEAFAAALGSGDPDELEALLRADNQAPLVTLATRPGLSTVEELLDAGAEPGRWSPYAAILDGGDPGSVPAIRASRAGVQDEGSQLAALAMAGAQIAGRDERWLDLCAGPGGKAALLSGLSRERGATLIASERLPHRAALVQSGLRGFPGQAPVLIADGRRAPWADETFDRVIADVPCSGLGALRRRPEARWRRQPDDVTRLLELQRSLLEAALDAVRAGGVVAYVTCSPHLLETRGIVDAVLAERADVREEDARALLPQVPDLGAGPHVQLWPHLHGTDAMFIALLRRTDAHGRTDHYTP